MLITSLGAAAGLAVGQIDGVEVLGHEGKVEWSLGSDGLHVQLPADAPSEFGVTVAVELAPEQPKLPPRASSSDPRRSPC